MVSFLILPFHPLPTVRRLDADNDTTAYGDVNLFCTCAPVKAENEDDITGVDAPQPT